MDKKELEKESKKDSGKEEKENVAEALMGGAGGEEESAWEPNMDWLMGSLGPFFNNNQGIGELLLDKLKDSGVNTEGVALAGLVNVLQQFSKEYKSLSEAVGQNLDRINELSAENEDLSAKIQEIVREMGMSSEDGGTPPDMGMEAPGMGGDEGGGMAPDMGGGEMPPPDMGGGAPPMDAGGGMPPDMGGAPPMGGGEMPPPDMGGAPPMGGGEMPPPDMGGGIVSDRRMKRLARSMIRQRGGRKSSGTSFNNSLIDACRREY